MDDGRRDICEALLREKAASNFNRRQHVPTVVSTEVEESKQVHRDATKDHSCIVAAVVQQVEEVSKERLTTLLMF